MRREEGLTSKLVGCMEVCVVFNVPEGRLEKFLLGCGLCHFPTVLHGTSSRASVSPAVNRAWRHCEDAYSQMILVKLLA